jgi:hypothetical protein
VLGEFVVSTVICWSDCIPIRSTTCIVNLRLIRNAIDYQSAANSAHQARLIPELYLPFKNTNSASQALHQASAKFLNRSIKNFPFFPRGSAR